MYEALKPLDHTRYWDRLLDSLPSATRLLAELERWTDPPPPPDDVADSCVVATVPGSLRYTPETWRVLDRPMVLCGGWLVDGIEIERGRPRAFAGQTLWRLRDGSFRVSGIPPKLRALAEAERRAEDMLRGGR